MVNFQGTVLDDGVATTSGNTFAPVDDCAVIDINGNWIMEDIEDTGIAIVNSRVTASASAFHVGSKFYVDLADTAGSGQQMLGYNFSKDGDGTGKMTMIRGLIYGADNATTSALLNYTPGQGGSGETTSVRLINVSLLSGSIGISIGGMDATDTASLYARCMVTESIDAPSGLDDYILSVTDADFATALTVDIQESYFDDRQGGLTSHDRFFITPDEFNCQEDAGPSCDGGGDMLVDNEPAGWTLWSDALSFNVLSAENFYLTATTATLGRCGAGKACEFLCDTVYTEQLHTGFDTIPAFVFGAEVTAWSTGGQDRNMGGVNP